jgi:hypothetical protein
MLNAKVEKMLDAETFLAFSIQPLALVWFPPSAFSVGPF